MMTLLSVRSGVGEARARAPRVLVDDDGHSHSNGRTISSPFSPRATRVDAGSRETRTPPGSHATTCARVWGRSGPRTYFLDAARATVDGGSKRLKRSRLP